jgi:hypothetical protein
MSEDTTLVRIHGLLGEPDGVLIEMNTEELSEGTQFIYENVGYQVTRVIFEDVEHPNVYVMVLDIYVQQP